MLTRYQSDLAEQIKRLEADRQRHAHAMAEIDQVLARINDALSAVRSIPGLDEGEQSQRDTGNLVAEVFPQKRHRGRFNQTAIQSVLAFIRDRGNPSTAEINGHWRSEGRKGTVNVTLLKLLKDGLIHRVHDQTVRGSRYVIADGAAPEVEETEATEETAELHA
jgi:hypothetical protein